MTTENGTPWTTSDRVHYARLRWDEEIALEGARQLRERADELEHYASVLASHRLDPEGIVDTERAPLPTLEALATKVRTQHYSAGPNQEAKAEAVARFSLVTGASTFHAAYVLHAGAYGATCGCSPCAKATEARQAEALERQAPRRPSARGLEAFERELRERNREGGDRG